MNLRTVPMVTLAVLALAAFVPTSARAAITLKNPSLRATVDLGDVTFYWKLNTAPGSDGGNVTIQIFLLNSNTKKYEEILPRDASGAPVVLPLVPDGSENSGSFTVALPVGKYGNGKAVLFAADSNFSNCVGSFGIPPMNFEVKTDAKRVISPIIIPGTHDLQAPGVDGKLHVPFTVRYPAGFQPQGNGFWIMVKGAGVFKQDFLGLNGATHQESQGSQYEEIKGELVTDMPTAPGVYDASLGLFDSNWKTIQWIDQGVEFDLGDWIVRADPARYPSVSQAIARGKAPFFLGGNFGNAIASIGKAANDDPTYYKLLHSAAGLTVLRENFDPQRYEVEPVYRKKVAQMVENMLSAGIVPCLAPQDMPPGDSLEFQAAKLQAVDEQMARDFAGKPVIFDVLNEPHDYASWAQWKPVATTLARGIKTANPSAFVVVESEGYAEDMTGPSESPIDPGLVDLYGWHSYHATVAELPKKAGHGIPVWLEEYHNPSLAFHVALTRIPNLKGIAAWAWTTPGQDSIPLVQSVNGADLHLNDDGQKIADYYRTWREGKKLSAAAGASE